jgi:hypothetical protein
MRIPAARIVLLALFVSVSARAQPAPPPTTTTKPAANRWAIQDDGSILWKVEKGKPHADHIEMSGRFCSVIVTYGVDAAQKPTLSRQVVWPMLRFTPNKTRDHLMLTFSDDVAPRLIINQGAPRNEVVTSVRHKGVMTIAGTIGRNREVAFTRTIFPSPDRAAVIEKYVLTNASEKPLTIEVEQNERTVATNEKRGIYGGYFAQAIIQGAGERQLAPGESTTSATIIYARKASEPEMQIDVDAELAAREKRVSDFLSKLRLETPDKVLNTAFAFAKIRAAESIYLTKAGPMHGPGGGQYYAAVWANDQAEYANPFFAFLGDDYANESAMVSYRQFAKFMNPEYKAIPSSITGEGETFWHGAGDRGDAAMIAYGASRFALANGKRDTAEELWPLIVWCLEFSRRKVNADGVVASDSDELENRFPAGKANLCTSSLYYDALRSAALLGKELGKPSGQLAKYDEQAKALRDAIARHFGATVEGFKTYRYYDGNTTLRAWICMPLTVDIYDRADETVKALFSPRLWTVDGLATEAGKETFWDRSTLYALRGVFAAGATQKALDYLTYYSNRRLLGDHVPYPIEAWPENNQRHLSAESSLYCRIYTEGMFGIRPTGFRSFDITPRLPKDWPAMKLTHVHAFGEVFDLSVTRGDGGKLKIDVARAGKPPVSTVLAENETGRINLASEPVGSL